MKISFGTPMAWYLKSEIHRWVNSWINDLARTEEVQVVECEGSLVDRNWNKAIMTARDWKPDWFVMRETDVSTPMEPGEFAQYLEEFPYDAVMSPGGSIDGWMHRPELVDSPGARILQDFSFWQNVRRNGGAQIWADPALRSRHHHAYGTMDSLTTGGLIPVFEGWMGFAAIRGRVLQRLKPLFRMAEVDYYCATNDLRV